MPPHHTHPPPDARSLCINNLGADGGKAIAAVLPQTKITTLECAPPSHPHSPVARALLTPAAGPVQHE